MIGSHGTLKGTYRGTFEGRGGVGVGGGGAQLGDFGVDLGNTLVPLPVHERAAAERCVEEARAAAAAAREREARKARLLLLHCVTDLHVAADPLPLTHELPCPLESARLGGAIAVPVPLGAPVDAAYGAVGAALGLPRGSFRLFVMRRATDDDDDDRSQPLRPAELLPFSKGHDWVHAVAPEDGEAGAVCALPFLPPFLKGEGEMAFDPKMVGEVGRGWWGADNLPTVDEFFPKGESKCLAAELPRADSADAATVGGAKARADALRALPPGVAALAEHFGGFDAWDAWAAGAAAAQLALLPPPPPLLPEDGASGGAPWAAPQFKPADVTRHAALFVQLLPHAGLAAALAAAAALQPLPSAEPPELPPEAAVAAAAAAASLHPTLRLLAPLAPLTLHNTAVAASVAMGDRARSTLLMPALPGYEALLAKSRSLAPPQGGPGAAAPAAHLRPDCAIPGLHARLTHDLLPTTETPPFLALSAVMTFRLLRSPEESAALAGRPAAAAAAAGAAPVALRPFFSGPCGYAGMLLVSRGLTVGELLLSAGRFFGLAPPAGGGDAPPWLLAAARAEDAATAPKGWPARLEEEGRRTLDGLSAGDDHVLDRWLLKRLAGRLQLLVWGMELPATESAPATASTREPTPIESHMFSWQLWGFKAKARTIRERATKSGPSATFTPAQACGRLLARRMCAGGSGRQTRRAGCAATPHRRRGGRRSARAATAAAAVTAAAVAAVAAVAAKRRLQSKMRRSQSSRRTRPAACRWWAYLAACQWPPCTQSMRRASPAVSQ